MQRPAHTNANCAVVWLFRRPTALLWRFSRRRQIPGSKMPDRRSRDPRPPLFDCPRIGIGHQRPATHATRACCLPLPAPPAAPLLAIPIPLGRLGILLRTKKSLVQNLLSVLLETTTAEASSRCHPAPALLLSVSASLPVHSVACCWESFPVCYQPPALMSQRRPGCASLRNATCLASVSAFVCDRKRDPRLGHRRGSWCFPGGRVRCRMASRNSRGGIDDADPYFLPDTAISS